MKTVKKIFPALGLLILCHMASAQSGFGIKLGLGTEWDNVQTKGSLEDADYSYSLGLFLRLGGEQSFYLQPEFLWSANESRLNFQDESTGDITGEVLSNKLNTLKIPVIFGFHFLGQFLDIQVGPLATLVLNNDQTVGLGGVASNLSNFMYGYQAGVGVNLGNFQFDVRYQQYFDAVEDSQLFPQSVQATLGIRIF